MTCGSCPYTDDCCYTSLPPKVKCTITGEFHYYGDECDCKDARETKEALLDTMYKTIREPILAYDPANPPVLNGSVENTAKVDWSSLIKVSERATTTTIGATNCLICGENIFINAGENSLKICDTCKKTIRYIREKFRAEIECLN